MTRKLISLTLLACFLLASLTSAQVSVTTQHNDNARTGANLQETTLTTSNVNVSKFGKLFSRSVSSKIWAQPLYMQNVTVPGKGTHNVIYVTTEISDVYAFDADDPAQNQPLWTRDLIPPPLGLQYSVGTPVIDPVAGTLFVVAKVINAGVTEFRLHALDITNGADRLGSPVIVTATVPGTGRGSVNSTQTLRSAAQKQRPGLLLSNGNVYLSFGGSVDEFDPNAVWNGWVVAYNATTLAQTAVFCVSPDANGGGIWQAGGGLAADAQGNVYCVTSNGNGNPNSFSAHLGGRDYGDSILKLSPSLALLDYFTPFNQDYLELADQDLGSSGPMLVPGTNLLVTGEKQKRCFVVDRSNLGHYRSTDNGQIVQEFLWVNGHVHGTPAYWNGPQGPHVYVWSENDWGKAYKYNGTTLNTTPAMKTPNLAPPGMPGGFLSISANGSAAGSGILWSLLPHNGDANKFVVPGVLRAYDANNLSKELYNSMQLPGRDEVGNFAKFACPTVANGKVYVPTFSYKIHCYGLLPTTAVPAAPSGLTATPGHARVALNWPAVAGATSYSVRRGSVAGGPYWLIAQNLTATTFLDTAVTNGTTYYYVITAASSGGTSGYSNQAVARPFPPAVGTAISIDFVGGGAANGTPAAMATGETAGVVSVNGWNAASGANGTLPALVTYGGAVVPTSASWSSLNTSSTPIAETAGNNRMMKGYLSGDNTSATSITVNNLPAAFASNGYDVYVYVDGVNADATRSGNYTIGGTTITVTDPQAINFYGTFVPPGVGDAGNYIVFPNQTASSFTLNAVQGATTDATPRAPVNGIQIVARQVAAALPSAPGGIIAVPGDARVTVSWNPVAGATYYSVKRALSAAGPFTNVNAALASTSYANTGLTNGTTYYYKVSASNSLGEGLDSAIVSATPAAKVLRALSIDLVGGSSLNGFPTAMASAETAGVVPASHWNPASGATGTVTNLVEHGGASSSASVSWSATGTYSLPITEAAGNARMMKGYLNTNNTSTTTVTVANLPAIYQTNSFNLYIYTDGANLAATRGATFTVAGKTYTCSDANGVQFSGTFTLGTNATGNYVRINSLSGSGFTLTATPGPSTDATPRAAINGIQIVARDFPNIKPTLTIASPANNSAVSTLTQIAGTASAPNGSGISKVQVSLEHRKSDGVTYEFWNGTSWGLSTTYRPSIYDQATGNWVLSDLPVAPLLLEGYYMVRVQAYDYSGLVTNKSNAFTLDLTPPAVTISTPADGATSASLGPVTGTIVENGSGMQSVGIEIKRLADDLYWNSTQWVAGATSNVAAITATTFTLNSNLPAGADLPDGQYEIKAVGLDKAGRLGVNSVTVNVVQPAALRYAAPASLKTAEAYASTGSVRLDFRGRLQGDKNTFAVTVNGRAVALDGVEMNVETGEIFLILRAGSTKVGDSVLVYWRDLRDKNGNRIVGPSWPVKVR